DNQQTPKFQLYTNTLGRFSIEYPTGWKVIPSTMSENTGIADIDFYSSPNSSPELQVAIQNLSSLNLYTQNLTFTTENIHNYVDTQTRIFHGAFPNFTIYDINLSINKVDGYPAITTQASRAGSNLEAGTSMMHIFSIIDGRGYQLIYSAP